MSDARLPRLQARFASTIWKGKKIEADGEFVNQFPGFKALHGRAEIGISAHDGKPCILMTYPPNTPLFGNSWDELRGGRTGLVPRQALRALPLPALQGLLRHPGRVSVPMIVID